MAWGGVQGARARRTGGGDDRGRGQRRHQAEHHRRRRRRGFNARGERVHGADARHGGWRGVERGSAGAPGAPREDRVMPQEGEEDEDRFSRGKYNQIAR